jgi:hypothetical protein
MRSIAKADESCKDDDQGDAKTDGEVDVVK